MPNKFNDSLKKLQKILFLYDGLHSEKKFELLRLISRHLWQNSSQLQDYHRVLLFIATHPENTKLAGIANAELRRISLYLKSEKKQASELRDSGLPYTRMLTRYSHDLLTWLNKHKECSLNPAYYDTGGTDLNTLLALTLPALERDVTTIGLNNDALLDALKVQKKYRLTFLLNEFSKLDNRPLVKDHLWDSLKIWVDIEFKANNFSISFNRIPQKTLFLQNEIIKKFDHNALINQKLEDPKNLNKTGRAELIDTIRKSLTLNMRETDPSTYMDESSLRLFELERGISIAIYGMKPERQMALQSYIGYTLFKNGYPAAYGGSWVFGRTALFGINISEYLRGGESGYLMCQLLRVYKQVFGIVHFEVEPYQYGLDNPDGLKTGAFWFYYRYGFRPADKTLEKLAEKEYLKIKSIPGYKTSVSILKRFTKCNIILKLNDDNQIKLSDIKTGVTKLIAKEFKGDRIRAEVECIKSFLYKTGTINFKENEKLALNDIAFLAQILKINDTKRLGILTEMIRIKPIDPYRYNGLVCEFFDEAG